MAYNYSKLIGKITEKFGTRAKFAEAMRLSEHSLSFKLNGKQSFKQDEIDRARMLLKLADADIGEYFFTLKVQ